MPGFRPCHMLVWLDDAENLGHNRTNDNEKATGCPDGSERGAAGESALTKRQSHSL